MSPYVGIALEMFYTSSEPHYIDMMTELNYVNITYFLLILSHSHAVNLNRIHLQGFLHKHQIYNSEYKMSATLQCPPCSNFMASLC